MTAADVAQWVAIAAAAGGAFGAPVGLGLRALARGLTSVARELRELRIKVEVMTEVHERRVAPQIRRKSDAAAG